MASDTCLINMSYQPPQVRGYYLSCHSARGCRETSDSVVFYNSAHSWALRRLHLMRFSEGLQTDAESIRKNLIKNQPQPNVFTFYFFLILFHFFRCDRSGPDAGTGCYATLSDRWSCLPRRANNRGVSFLWRTINLVRKSDTHRNSEYKEHSPWNNSPAEIHQKTARFLITLATLRLKKCDEL